MHILSHNDGQIHPCRNLVSRWRGDDPWSVDHTPHRSRATHTHKNCEQGSLWAFPHVACHHRVSDADDGRQSLNHVAAPAVPVSVPVSVASLLRAMTMLQHHSPNVWVLLTNNITWGDASYWPEDGITISSRVTVSGGQAPVGAHQTVQKVDAPLTGDDSGAWPAFESLIIVRRPQCSPNPVTPGQLFESLTSKCCDTTLCHRKTTLIRMEAARLRRTAV